MMNKVINDELHNVHVHDYMYMYIIIHVLYTSLYTCIITYYMYMYMCMCTCMCACVCMCVCVWGPMTYPLTDIISVPPDALSAICRAKSFASELIN